MKKITSYLLVAVMLLALIPFSAFSVSASADVDLWDGTSTPFEYGSGTEDDPYLITTAEELAYFAQSVNSGYSYAGEYIKLTTNIKLNDESFIYNPDSHFIKATDGTNEGYIYIDIDPSIGSINSAKLTWCKTENKSDIGEYSGEINSWPIIGKTQSKCFSGYFDGNGHTVNGVYYNNHTVVSSQYASTYQAAGLFGYVNGGKISNLLVQNSVIANTIETEYYDATAYSDVGAIIGNADNCYVENCYTENSAIIGESSNRSYNSGTGGIVGNAANVTISRCHNASWILSSDVAGGIVGTSGGNKGTIIENCYNRGYVCGMVLSGGIIGGSASKSNSTSTSIRNCYVAGSVKSALTAYAIVGGTNWGISSNKNASVTLTNCYYKNGCAANRNSVPQKGSYTITTDSAGTCVPLSNEELSKKTSFVGFDFENIWKISPTYEYGYPMLKGQPFVQVDECDHFYTSVNTLPSCASSGFTTHTCAICDNVYVTDRVSATGHNYVASITAPTCTERGYTAHTCSTCGDSYTDSYVTANGHKTNAVVDCDTAKVCSVCGVTVESAKGHSYVDKVTAPTCTEQGYTTHTCSACSDSYTDSYVRSNGHTAGEKADCTHDQICTSCGTTLVEALGHTEGEWKIVVEATVGEKGLMEQYCDDCDTLLDSKEIPALEEDETYLLGDVNGDTKVDSVDYLLVKRACFKTYALSEEEAVRADVNVDNKIDSTDYLLVKRIAFGTYTIN